MLEEFSRRPAKQAAVLHFTRLTQVSSQRGFGDLRGWRRNHGRETDHAGGCRRENHNQDSEGDAWTQHLIQLDRILLERRVQQNSRNSGNDGLQLENMSLFPTSGKESAKFATYA